MCGLTFVGSNSIGFRDIEIFEQMVFSDTLRGDHSTGVCSIFKGQESEQNLFKVLKAAMPGPAFIAAGHLEDVMSIRKASSAGKHTIITRPIAAFGHNRYATKGEVSPKNAHPFTHGKITLAHNGTLTGQHRLPDYKQFEVDSENIAYSIDKIGFAETLKLLEGAFTLIWYNSEEETVNIIRNKDRPFYLAKTSTNDWFGASEKDMLLWILGRQKTSVTITEQFECEPGMQYIFNVKKGVFSFKEKVKHELPSFYRFQYTKGASYLYTDDYEYSFGRDYTTPSTVLPWKKKEEEQTKMMKEIGMKTSVGDFITFSVYEKEDNSNYVSEYCTFKGYLDPSDKVDTFVEVTAHGQKKSEFDTSKIYKGKIVRVEGNDVGGLNIIVGTVSVTEERIDTSESETAVLLLPSIIKDVNLEEERVNNLLEKHGVKSSSIQYEAGDELLFEALGFRYTYPAAGMGCIYGKCVEDGLRDLIIETEYVTKDEYLKDGIYSSFIKDAVLEDGTLVVKVEDAELVATNYAAMCVIEPPSDDEEDDGEVVEYSLNPLDDNDVPFEDTSDNHIKTLKTGQVFTKSTWSNSVHSTCCECGNPIPFLDVDKTSIVNNFCFCEACNEKRTRILSDTTESSSVNGILSKHGVDFKYGEVISFLAEEFMPYGNLVDNVGSVFGKSSTESFRVIATNFTKADFKKNGIYSGKISSVKVIGNELRVYLSGPFLENKSFFFCEECNKRLPLIQKDLTSSKSVCYKCNKNTSARSPSIIINKPVKALKNGHIVPKVIWNAKMGVCKQCGNGIPWELAESTTLIGDVPICCSCEKKLA